MTAAFETTDRGFKHYEPIETRYGHEITVYESSSAEIASVWLRIESTDATAGIDPEDATALLSLDQVDKLVLALLTAKANHYHLSSDG